MSDGDDIRADPRVSEIVKRYWGFDSLRPLQAQAIAAGIEHRDSLVVLPTGGGKSLCYQVPPIVADRLDVVVSPLIALMKDQVDGLRQNGYPAAAVHSNLSPAERQELRAGVRSGAYKLLFVSPERLLAPEFIQFLRTRDIRAFAIDEAHCISQWGHDFRLEYRRLRELKEHFPGASVHAYTATATKRVQQDIVEQLGLTEPRVIVGTFDRPNLVYRILPSFEVYGQTLEIVRRHANEAAIVYCISRKDTEAMAAFLKANGVKAAAYHAGMERAERSRTQEAFAAEELDVVAATVAFGMGIDRSNVRCVIHAAMPKTIEHYQQETGRAGRDGLEAECVLLYSYGDVRKWERLIELSAEKAADPEQWIAAQKALLQRMQSLCNTPVCRHRALSRYFGQEYPKNDCQACDYCLKEVKMFSGARRPDRGEQTGSPSGSSEQTMTEAANPTVIAQKILSCVYRTGQRFGVRYVVEVLRGGRSAQILQRGHDQLSTHGLLRDLPEKTIQNLVYQLIDQGLLDQTPGEYPVAVLNENSLDVLRGERDVQLIDPQTKVSKTSVESESWEGVDRELFERLRELRRGLAIERSVPAFVIFGDSTLRELARSRPTTLPGMRSISGVGERKLEEFGEVFTEAIASYCKERGVSSDVAIAPAIVRPTSASKPNPLKLQAMSLFAQGAPIERVAQETGRARSTVWGYLAEFVEEQKPERVDPWVKPEEYERIIRAAAETGADRLKAIYDHLGEQVDFNTIRISLIHHRVRSESAERSSGTADER